MDAENCSTLGQVLILAEAAAGMLKPGAESRNISVAFKLSGGVYPSKPLAALNQMLKSLPHIGGEIDKKNVMERLSRKLNTLDEVQSKLTSFLNNSDNPQLVEHSAMHLNARVGNLKRSIFDAGTHYYLDEDSWINVEDDQMIMHELENATSEIGWQIQDMLRDTTLHLVDFKLELPVAFVAITEQLAQVYLKKQVANVKQ